MTLDVENTLIKLQDLGLVRLNRPIGDWYSIYCPLPHNGHYEQKPSCGVLLHDQYKGDKKYPAGFFHCFRGDTEVITKDGLQQISLLCDKSNVFIINGEGQWENVVFHNYGTDQLWKLTLSRDNQTKVIYTTQAHEWFVNKKANVYTTDKLKSGWYLQSLIRNPESFNLITEGIIHGIIYGDGTRTFAYKNYGHGSSRIKDKTHPIGISYRVNIPRFSKKVGLVKYFEDNSNWTIRERSIEDKEYYLVWSCRMPLEHNFKMVPSLNMGRDYLMSFLAGYFACDGSIDLMKLHSSKVADLRKIQDICLYCGISTTDVKVITHSTNYLTDATLAMLYLYPRSIPAEFYLLDSPKLTAYSRSRWRVESVEPTDIYEDVYCCETSTHSFVLGGNILTHNCFSCGLAKSMPDTITEILKTRGISKSGFDWLTENVPGFDPEVSEFDYLIPQDISQQLNNKYALDYINSKIISESKSFVPESELASYRMIVPYMYQRGLTDEIIEKYDIGYDANFIPPGRKKPMPCITFPVKDLSGNTLFLCRRSIEGKFFHYPQGVEKSVYGIYELPKGVRSVIICESCLNALRLVSYGYNAVALLGTGTSYEINQLKQLGVQEYILCLDGDEAGQRGAAKLKKALSQTAIIWTVHMPPDKDANDCKTKEEFDQYYDARD